MKESDESCKICSRRFFDKEKDYERPIDVVIRRHFEHDQDHIRLERKFKKSFEFGFVDG